MKINRRIIVQAALTLTAIGFIVSFLGYAINGFSIRGLQNTSTSPWYQTVHLGDENRQFGFFHDDNYDDDYYEDYEDFDDFD